MSSADSDSATSTELRKRALIDAAIGLVLTMLIWPFPIARAMLPPVINVVGILIAWGVVNVLYHAICARTWRRTAGTHLLGLSLSSIADDSGVPGDAAALRWGLVAGALVVVNAVWGGASGVVAGASHVVLRRD